MYVRKHREKGFIIIQASVLLGTVALRRMDVWTDSQNKHDSRKPEQAPRLRQTYSV